MINVLKVEFIKLKTSSLIAIIVMITLAPLFNGVSVSDKLSNIGSNPNTLEAIYDFSINGYTLVILPTIIIVTFAIIMRFERVSGGMKEILTLPVTKKQLFLSKLFTGVLLIMLSIFLFFTVIIIVAFLKNGITEKSILLILSRGVSIFLVSLGFMAVQFFLSLSYENISVPLGLGFCFLIPSFLLSDSRYKIFYPWSYMTAVNSSNGFDRNSIIMITISILIFLIVNILGYFTFNRKDIC
ncbi:ABC transporter permease [Clostridium sp. YIM B02505]|uniref:ABC transporter permease n=1 Tax=Clostridium yunnanense TaxID=2800325 RepID=A0ABS1EWK0_9CLOT|nr:ABC transporter permease [Clostridium yunnanense]MBK1813754.1 ABC transporter permease [Clostridium yunnanense]